MVLETTSNRLKAVETIRLIRDEQYELLKDMTPEEQVAFIRRRANELHARLKLPLPKELISVQLSNFL